MQQLSVANSIAFRYILEMKVEIKSLLQYSEFLQSKGQYWFLRLLVVGSQQPIIEENHRWQILVNERVEIDEL